MLEIKHFSKSYIKGKPVIRDLSLTVSDGEIFGFIGQNGAGKTTTIKCIVGAQTYSDGEILLDGTDIRKDPVNFKKKVVYIPDNPDLYEFMSGIRFLNFLADIYGISAESRTEDIKKYAKAFGIENVLGDAISSYSHGMKQKLALISAFMRRPRLMVLDEPFVGLDPAASHLLKGYMREFAAAGCAIFFSTHVLEVAEKLCDKVGIIKNGEMIVNGSMEEIVGNKSLEDVFLELADQKANG